MTRARALSDTGIVARAKRGDAVAQEAVYRAYAPMVFTLARRMLASPSLAEDMLQETFVEVLLKLGDFRGELELGAWIRRIAINKCLMCLRSSWMSRRVELGPAPEPLRQGVANAAEDQLALEAALDALSPAARAVVWLHDVEGYTHKEIAALVGRSSSFSKSQLARAHERLRISLRDDVEECELPLCTRVLKTC